MTWGTGLSSEWTASDQGDGIRTEPDFSCQACLENQQQGSLSPASLTQALPEPQVVSSFRTESSECGCLQVRG